MIATVTVFLSVFLLDFVWAKYTYAMTEKRALGAGTYSAAIIVLSGTAAVGYVHNPWMLIPAALGAFVGTFVAVKVKK